MDKLFSKYLHLWGGRQALELMENGQLDNFLPFMVNRLLPETKDRAMDFFNGLIRTYLRPDMHSILPAKLREQFDKALKDKLSCSHSYGPDLRRYSVAMSNATNDRSWLADRDKYDELST